jgi:hypothetical protein
MFETLLMYSERFHKTYQSYKATGTMADPVDVKETVQVMDFSMG